MSVTEWNSGPHYRAVRPTSLARIPFWREWLGDEAVAFLQVASHSAEQDDQRMAYLFPEAKRTILGTVPIALDFITPVPNSSATPANSPHSPPVALFDMH
jgi:hypothetical protein